MDAAMTWPCAAGAVVGLGLLSLIALRSNTKAALLRTITVAITFVGPLAALAWSTASRPVVPPLKPSHHAEPREMIESVVLIASLVLSFAVGWLLGRAIRAGRDGRVIRVCALAVVASSTAVVLAATPRTFRDPGANGYLNSLPVVASVPSAGPPAPPWTRDPNDPTGRNFRFELVPNTQLLVTFDEGWQRSRAVFVTGEAASQRSDSIYLTSEFQVRRDQKARLWLFAAADNVDRVQVNREDGSEANGLWLGDLKSELGPPRMVWALSAVGCVVAWVVVFWSLRRRGGPGPGTDSAEGTSGARFWAGASLALLSTAPLAVYLVRIAW